MKNPISIVSLGKGPRILQYSFLTGLGISIILFNSYPHRAALLLAITGILSGVVSLYFSFVKKEVNTIFGIPTWIFGLACLIWAFFD